MNRLFLILTLFITIGISLDANAQCTNCTYTAPSGGTNFNLNGNETLCITANASNLGWNMNGTGNKICVATGVVWDQPFGGNLQAGTIIDVYGTLNLGGGFNVNGTPPNAVINVHAGATLNNSGGFGNGVTVNNDGIVNFTSSGAIDVTGTFILNNSTTGTVNALATTNFKLGNGATINNDGALHFANFENEEGYLNNNTGAALLVDRSMNNHGAFINNGDFQIPCTTLSGAAGATTCSFRVGDKGVGKEFISNNCIKVLNGNVTFDGPGTLNAGFEIGTGYNLTINKTVTGTNGSIRVNGGISTINLSGNYIGTNMTFYDVNTSGNDFDTNVGNNPSSYTISSSAGCNTVIACTAPTAVTAGSNSPVNEGSAINLTSSSTGGTTYSWAGPNAFTSTTQNPAIASATAAMAGTYTVTVLSSGTCTATATVAVTVTPTTVVNCLCLNNLITTPSFEGGDLTAWKTATNDPSGNILFSNDSPYTVCGSSYGYIRSANADAFYASIYQDVAATAGTLYNLSVYAGTHDPTQDSQVKLEFYDASNTLLSVGQIVQVDTDVDIAPFTLAQYNLSGTAPLGTSYVRVTFYTQGVYIGDNMAFKFDNVCLSATTVACTAPTAVTATSNSPVTQDSSINLTSTSTGGTTYSWTGPNGFTSTTQNPAITSATSAMSGTYTVTVLSSGTCTATATTAVVVNTAPACSISSVTAVPGSCTPATNKFDLTGQVTFTNAPTSGIMRVRIPGKGYQDFTAPFTSPLSYTITGLNSDGLADTVEVNFSSGGCFSTVKYTAPVMCLPSVCVSPETAGVQTYTSTLPLARTNWNNLPLTLPKFDNLGGTRVLKNVILTVNQSIRNWGVAESTDASETEINLVTNGTNTIKLNGTTLTTNNFSATNYPKTVAAGILVPAQGAWAGDATFTSPPSTLLAMSTAVNADLNNLIDPTLASTWVTNATGNPTTDDDMTYFAPVYSDGSKCVLYSAAPDLANFTGTGNLDLTASAAGSSNIDGAGNVNSIIKTAASAEVSVTYIYCNLVCSPPTAVTAGSNSPVAEGSAINLTSTSTGGTIYSWAGPNGFTSTTQNPSIASATAAMTGTYTVTVLSSGTCTATATTAVVVNPVVIPCTTSASVSQVSCHDNATLDSSTDDYITMLLTPSGGKPGTKFTITATQAGSPITLQLSDGSAIDSLSYAYPTPLRSAVGTAGHGNIIITMTDKNNPTCKYTVTITDPGVCSTTTCNGTPQTVSYTYRTPFMFTDLTAVPVLIPQFDTGGGTRTLVKAELKYGMVQGTILLTENTSVSAQNFKFKINAESVFELGAATLLDNIASYSTGTAFIPLPSAIVVPASGTYGGDLTYGSGTNVSTLEGMKSWLDAYMTDIYVPDPTTDARWVTNATGVATNDDDIFFIPTQTLSGKDSTTYTTTADLAQFIGTGNLPLAASTFDGLSTTGGGGNLVTKQNTKAYAYATVVYTYTCSACTIPVITTTVTEATCTGSTANSDAKIEITSTNSDKYTITQGATSTATYAAATALTAGAGSLTALANPASATQYTIRVFNGSDACFKDTTITINPVTCTVVCVNPTIIPTVMQATCTGSVANNDASIAFTSTNSDKYTITQGATSSATYAAATTLTAGAGSLTALPNPASDTQYTIRIFNGSDACFKDTTIMLSPVVCTVVCINPTINPTVMQATCTGSVANSDASITFTSTNSDKYTITQGASSTATYAAATALSAGAGSLTGLPNPASATQYTIRVFNGNDTCFTDITIMLNPKNCTLPCPYPNCGSVTVQKN